MRLLLLFAVAGLLAAQSDAELAQGRKLFEGHCGLCHGQTGTGGKGPNLAQPSLVHAPDTDSLIRLIQAGIPGTEMPGTSAFSPTELLHLASYIRSLGRTAVAVLPGSPADGRKVYLGKGGCAGCHIVHGEGVGFGPELSDIGARRNAEYLREALLKPGAAVPAAFLVVSVTTRDGKPIRGMRINEDTFTLQMRDGANRFYSFRKADLVSYKKEFDQSLMPSFGNKLNAAELDDLVAYLATLRGEK
jgi:putative heme-binding domain-containing protein